ncbi:hypothetical protein OROHE_018500 [Orobanche hederae]
MKIFLLVFFLFLISISAEGLKVGFYSQTCPNAESIVKSVVRDATVNEPRMPSILLRLHFHDCFVEGCDGSILIKDGENNADGHQGLLGFEVITEAKQKVETQCPGVVSCADIVAMAARDAVTLAGGPIYKVETGRRDGRISNPLLAKDMPDVNDSIDTLKSKFRNKGLSEKELVLLSGGSHTIGTTACVFMTKRLYSFTGTNDDTDFDPEISREFLPELKRLCPRDGDGNDRMPLDTVTSDKFDDQSLGNIKNGFAVLASDARLYNDNITKQVVDSYIHDDAAGAGTSFGQDFSMAMIKMGRIGVKTGSDGEIRQVCDSFN